MFHGFDRFAIRKLPSNLRYLAKVEISCSQIPHARLSQFFVEKADKTPSTSGCRLQPKDYGEGVHRILKKLHSRKQLDGMLEKISGKPTRKVRFKSGHGG